MINLTPYWSQQWRNNQSQIQQWSGKADYLQNRQCHKHCHCARWGFHEGTIESNLKSTSVWWCQIFPCDTVIITFGLRYLKSFNHLTCHRNNAYQTSGRMSGWVPWWCHKSPALHSSQYNCVLYLEDNLEGNQLHKYELMTYSTTSACWSKKQNATF